MSASKKLATTPEKYGLMLVRLTVAAVFIMHGYQNLFGTTAGARRFIPGMGTGKECHACGIRRVEHRIAVRRVLALGLFTRIAAIPVVGCMIFFLVQTQWPHAIAGVTPSHEYVVLLGMAALALLLSGPGAMAGDNLRSGRK